MTFGPSVLVISVEALKPLAIEAVTPEIRIPVEANSTNRSPFFQQINTTGASNFCYPRGLFAQTQKQTRFPKSDKPLHS